MLHTKRVEMQTDNIFLGDGNPSVSGWIIQIPEGQNRICKCVVFMVV